MRLVRLVGRQTDVPITRARKGCAKRKTPSFRGAHAGSLTASAAWSTRSPSTGRAAVSSGGRQARRNGPLRPAQQAPGRNGVHCRQGPQTVFLIAGECMRYKGRPYLMVRFGADATKAGFAGDRTLSPSPGRSTRRPPIRVSRKPHNRARQRLHHAGVADSASDDPDDLVREMLQHDPPARNRSYRPRSPR